MTIFLELPCKINEIDINETDAISTSYGFAKNVSVFIPITRMQQRSVVRFLDSDHGAFRRQSVATEIHVRLLRSAAIFPCRFGWNTAALAARRINIRAVSSPRGEEA